MLPHDTCKRDSTCCEVSEAIALIWILPDCCCAGLGQMGMTAFHQVMLRCAKPKSKLKGVEVVVNKITFLK